MKDLLLALDKVKSCNFNRKFIKQTRKTISEFFEEIKQLDLPELLVTWLKEENLSDETKADIVKVLLETNHYMIVSDLVQKGIVTLDIYREGNKKRENARFWKRLFWILVK